MLYNDSDAGLVRLVLDEFSDPKCALRVNELFTYYFRSALGDAKSQPIILDWARQAGTQKDLPADRQLLRLIVLGKMHSVPGPEMLTEFLESTSPWMATHGSMDGCQDGTASDDENPAQGTGGRSSDSPRWGGPAGQRGTLCMAGIISAMRPRFRKRRVAPRVARLHPRLLNYCSHW